MKPSKLAFVVYEPGNSPRYFEMKKGLFRFLFFGLPSVTLLCILSVILTGAYFKQIREQGTRGKSLVIDQLKKEKSELALQLKKLEREQRQLTQKLSLKKKPQQPQQFQQQSQPKEFLNSLQLFKQSSGRQDLSNSPELSLEKIEVTPTSKNLELSFKIVNATQGNKRLSGHIFVMMKSNSQINIWPQNTFTAQEIQIEFHSGEPFAASRFRPVKAIFPRPATISNLLFKIIIFNKTGDLIFKKMISQSLKT